MNIEMAVRTPAVSVPHLFPEAVHIPLRIFPGQVLPGEIGPIDWLRAEQPAKGKPAANASYPFTSDLTWL
jgi:hypothetical protein